MINECLLPCQGSNHSNKIKALFVRLQRWGCLMIMACNLNSGAICIFVSHDISFPRSPPPLPPICKDDHEKISPKRAKNVIFGPNYFTCPLMLVAGKHKTCNLVSTAHTRPHSGQIVNLDQHHGCNCTRPHCAQMQSLLVSSNLHQVSITCRIGIGKAIFAPAE